mgnify:CR=1 FL=1
MWVGKGFSSACKTLFAVHSNDSGGRWNVKWRIMKSKTIQLNTKESRIVNFIKLIFRTSRHNEGFVRELQLLFSSYASHASEPFSQFVAVGWNKNLILSFYWVLIDFLLCDKNEISALCCIYFRLRVNHDVAIDWVLQGKEGKLSVKGWFRLAQHVVSCVFFVLRNLLENVKDYGMFDDEWNDWFEVIYKVWNLESHVESGHKSFFFCFSTVL